MFHPITSSAAAAEAMELFNSCSEAGETLYRPFKTMEEFRAFFLPEAGGSFSTVALSGEGAFAAGCYSEVFKKAFVTYIAVRPDRRRRGVGKAILSALEKELTALSGQRRYEIGYFNPMNFTWNIPGFPGHDHPNAPGVDVAGGGYLFLKNCGYRDYAHQNSYHLDLPDYRVPADMEGRAAALRERGIQITFYDGAKHTGLEELAEALGNPLWKKELLENAARPDGGRPLLIVCKEGKAMGFTGPLAVQPSGRGYFSGIAVHPDCRGSGAGKVLFSRLCTSLRDMGAGYMTLFTGEDNPARSIYETAGFRIVRTWADMRKEIREDLRIG